MALVKINDISPYFKEVNGQWIFVGEKLEIYIPEIYKDRGLLMMGESVTSLAIFEIRINDTFSAQILALMRVVIEPVSDHRVTEDGYKYIVLTLLRDSVFLANKHIVKDGNLIYDIFVTFLALGKVPPYLDYNSIHRLFDNDDKHCGVNLKVNHCVFEMIYAHMHRDEKDPYAFYRNTRMDKPPVIVPIHQISHGPISSSARVIGSYLSEGLTSALVDENQHQPSVIENLFRA